MTPTPDLKKKTLKQLNEINALLSEFYIKAKFSIITSCMLEFTCSKRPTNALMTALYQREGVEQVNWMACGRDINITIHFSEF